MECLNSKLYVFMLITFLPTAMIQASDFEKGGIYYNITSSESMTAEVTFRGSSFDEFTDEYSGNVVIPETVSYNGETYRVTSVGKSAFRDCTGLTDISIPGNVTSVANYAFNGCKGLKTLRFEDGVGTLSLGIHGGSFDTWTARKGLLYDCPLENMYVGRDLEYPTGLEGAYSPFYEKRTLLSVVISNKVTTIRNNMFIKCDNLVELCIEDGTENLTIGYNYETGSKHKYGLLQSVALQTLHLGRNVEYSDAQYPPFYDCYKLKNVTIGENVTTINDKLFYKCSGLEYISLPNSIDNIGSNAFYECRNLADVTMSDNVKSIGESAFSYCTALTTFTIPSSVETVENGAFYSCPLKELRIEDGTSVLHLGCGKYESNTKGWGMFTTTNLKSLYLGRNLEYEAIWECGYSPFYGAGLISVTTGPDVTVIGEKLFESCNSLTSVTLHEGLTSIGANAFDWCTSLENITLPNSITHIGNQAFHYCINLKEINIPDGITKIEDETFLSCCELANVVIPSSVENIGYRVFSGCNGLVNIYLQRMIPPTFSNSDYYNFNSELYSNAIVHVPEGSLDAYKTANVWRFFSNICEYNPAGINHQTNDNMMEVKHIVGGIILSNVAGKNVTIYSVSGKMLEYLPEYDNRIIALEKGVYIIHVGDMTRKVCFTSR